MTQPKIYCRSIRPDGYGEGVVPERPMPECWRPDNGSVEDCLDCWNWYRHLASLPVLYLIHPDLAKVGWVMEYGEQYWIRHGDRWSISDKDEYDSLPNDQRRLVLVPVEGKAAVLIERK